MSETAVQTTKKASKKPESAKTPKIQSIARRIAQDAQLLEQTAQRGEARRLAEHERVRALVALGTGGVWRLLRDSPLLSEGDKQFLSALKYFLA